jgi:hypothetical protein
MATSKNSPSAQGATQPPPGLRSGAAADLSGSMPPPKAPAQSKVKAKPAEGKSAEAKPTEGLSTAKPVGKGKSKGSSAAPQVTASARPAGGAAVDSPQAPPSRDSSQRSDAAAASNGSGSGSDMAQAGSPRVGESAATAAAQPRPEQPAAAQPATPPQGQRLSDEERQRRIAEAAYRKAQERGFDGDRHLEDWLEAERELDSDAGA